MQKEVALRLTTKGEDKPLKAIRDIGADGKKVGVILDRAGKQAGRGLKAIDEGAKAAKGGVEDLANRTGALSGPLKALGPIGVGAAAGIAGIFIGLQAAVRVGKEAVSTFAEIGKTAERLGIAAESYQALTAEAEAQGVANTQLETGLRALQERQSQIIAQQGELYTRLKDTNPELLTQLQALDNNEDRLRAVSKALGEAKTETDRLRIAYAAFGESGAEVSRVLLATDGDMDKLIDKGKALGLVIDEDLVRNSEALAVEMDVAAKVLDLQLKQAFIDFAPAALDMLRWLGDLAREARDFAEAFRDASDRTDDFRERQLQRQSALFVRRGASESRIRDAQQGGAPLTLDDFPDSFRKLLPGLQRDIDAFNEAVTLSIRSSMQDRVEEYGRSLAGMTTEALTAELDRIEAQIEERQQSGAGLRIGGVDLSDAGIELEAQRAQVRALKEGATAREAAAIATRKQLEAEQKLKDQKAAADKAERERLALRRQAATLLAELGDATLALAIKEEELTKQVAANFITQEQADQALTVYRDKLTGVTEATERWMDVVEGSRTEVQTVEKAIQDLNDDLAKGVFGEAAESAELYIAALKALTEALNLAKEAEKEATDEFKAAAEIRDKLAEVRRAAMTDQELLAAEEERVRQIVESGNLSREEATEYLRAYSEELRKARGQVSLLERAESLLDGIMNGRIKTTEDLGRAISAMIIDLVRQYALAQAQMGGGQGFGGFLQGVLGGIFGGGGVNPSGVPPITNSHAVPVGHTGHIIGMGARESRMGGMRIGSHERLVVGQVGEEIVPANDRAAIIDHIRSVGDRNGMPSAAAISGPIPLAINLNINQSGGGGDAEVSAGQSGENSFDIDVFFRDRIRGAASEGALDGALEGRGFVRQARR